MSLLAGLVSRDRHRVVTLERALATAAAGPAAFDASAARRVERPGVALAAGGDGVLIEEAGHAWLLADLDVNNLDELADLAGLPRGASGILLRLYDREGPGFLLRLRGAFALALGDRRTGRALLATDRFGLRRLYYAIGPEGLALASRPSLAAVVGGRPREVDADAVYAYLNFEAVPAPQTIYRAVRRLSPGHLLRWQDGEGAVERYWDLAYGERAASPQRAAAELVTRAEDAVRATLTGLDPKETGAFLSGGTDSSTVVGLMTRLTGERVNAFSIGFAEERYNELDYAELAARHFAAAHYTKLVSADDAYAAVAPLVEAYDEPFGNNSVIPTYLCARLARQTGMRTLLAGDGGDEIFGGNEVYRREQVLARYRRVPAPLRRGVIEPLLGRVRPGRTDLLGKAQRYVERARTPNPERFYASEFFVAQEREWLLHPDFRAATTADWPLEVARRHYAAAPARSELNRLLYLDVKIVLGDNDLYKVTGAAELAGLAVRFPMLDHPLVELTATWPASLKVRGAEKRYLFKRAFASLLPREILAKKKHGFGLPVSDWLKEHAGFRALLRDTLGARAARERGYFAPGAIDRLLALHEADKTPFHGGILWKVLMLELWHLRHGRAA